MANDDRFTLIAGTLAVLITAGLFFWSHWGSLATSTHPISVEIASGVTSVEEDIAPFEVNEDEQIPADIVPARLEIETTDSQWLEQASNHNVSSIDATITTLENIASGWSGTGVPAAAEILVRKDRDDRMVVAAGTHRRYTALKEELQKLDLAEIKGALLRADGTIHSTDPDSLRVGLIDVLDATLAVDVPEVEPDMVAGTHAWDFADAEFKALTKPQKHLLLMGRANAVAVQTKAAEIRQFLGKDAALEHLAQPLIPAEPAVIALASPSEEPLEVVIEP